MVKRMLLLSVLSAGISLTALAGGWVSSGGESISYTKNPWFVRNVQQVNYCVLMDESSFSISRSAAEQIISESFQYWKDEFQRNGGGGQATHGYAKIATQTFSLVSTCASDTPLIFKLGLKTLDAEEVEYLQDPKKFIGVTIRKQYDLVKLQGSGVIYISADIGADAYTNIGGLLIPNAWKNPALLKYAVIHELGHFFGIPHVGSGIMSEVFMTLLLNKNMTKEFSAASPLSFLNPQNNFEVCRDTSQFNPDFFLIPRNTACLKFESIAGSGLPKWEVSSRQNPASSYAKIGEVRVNAIDQSPYSLKTAVIVQVPESQKVFNPMETVAGPFLIGGVFSDISYKGSFVPNQSIKAYPLQMSLSSEKISLVGTVNGQQMTVMNYSSFGFLRAILP